ncbi:hypothetical protein LEN26_016446 [Aphanomyces euteiches]|nr:hypothetical protein LEN26_016446 [Aphanomyces euteiches]KAH9194213.1 hypothetical protein AeNC1_003819 [Aphanomyces euteiches]
MIVAALAMAAHALHPVGKVCKATSDCPLGSSCVAGEADESLQTCVADQVCGGNLPGNCPGFVEQGSLVCTWIEQDPADCTFGRCKTFNSIPGIYKCLSIDRCNKATVHSGANRCSKSCEASNGLTCNGRGICQSSGPDTFTCACRRGWNGTRCDNVVDGRCEAGLGHCGLHGECNNGTCSCLDGYTGLQCEIPTSKNLTTTTKPSTNLPTTTAASSSIVTTTVPSATSGESTVPPTLNTTIAPTNMTNGQSDNHASQGHSDKTDLRNKTLPITVSVLSSVAGTIILLIIMFAVYARGLRRRAMRKNEVTESRLESQESSTTPREHIQVL